MDLLARISSNLVSRNLFPESGRILVAVSGGLDSMVLLHVLEKLMAKHGWTLCVAHLNHSLRGAESDGDQRFVAQTSKQLGLKFLTEKCDVQKVAREQRISLEMAARKVRHKFLASAAKSLGASTVALGHHADDQAELFFLRLFRGGSGANLGGMHWQNPSPEQPEISLVRPMLNLSKSMLRKYAEEKGIAFREDKTNEHLEIPRNRIRRTLLPALRRDYQPALDEVVARAMEILRDENEWMNDLTQSELSRIAKGSAAGASEAFESLPIGLQRRCLAAQLDKKGIKPEFEMIEFLRLHPGVPASLENCSSELRGRKQYRSMRRNERGLIETGTHSDSQFRLESKTVVLKRVGGQKTFGEVTIQWRVKPVMRRMLPCPKNNQECFDAESVGACMTLRHWRPGDRFQPIGMKMEQKVQDFLTNEKIPHHFRRHLVIAEAEHGKIFWIEGMRISEQFKLTERTKVILFWRWQRNRRA